MILLCETYSNKLKISLTALLNYLMLVAESDSLGFTSYSSHQQPVGKATQYGWDFGHASTA